MSRTLVLLLFLCRTKFHYTARNVSAALLDRNPHIGVPGIQPELLLAQWQRGIRIEGVLGRYWQ